ncbi:hypothetical protein D3C75_809470 [compost metagenome]
MENILAAHYDRSNTAAFQLLLNLNELIIGFGKLCDAGVGISFFTVDNALRHVPLHRGIPHLTFDLRRVLEQFEQVRWKLYDFPGIGKHLRITHFNEIRELTHSIFGLQPIQISGRGSFAKIFNGYIRVRFHEGFDGIGDGLLGGGIA